MSKKIQTPAKPSESAGSEPVQVQWDASPIDVSLQRHGTKSPDRKVKVRGILRDEWLEREAGLEPGAIGRLMGAIKKALQHGYEPRLDESVRFVHLIDSDFSTMRVSVQPMGSFRNCLANVAFRMLYEGQEMTADEAMDLREDDEHEESEVTPDQMVTCPKCRNHFRVGKRIGK